MATVHYGDHEPFEIDDNRADLVAYYRGEGATVTGVAGEVERPADSAKKPAWVEFAVAQGMDPDEAELLTVKELQKL